MGGDPDGTEWSEIELFFPDALPKGTRLGDYEIVRPLGQGGFGITYEGRHVFLGRRVAIKEFYIKAASRRASDGTVSLVTGSEASGITPEVQASLLARFEREAKKVAAKFDHPSIVQGEAYFVANGVGYFVMRYVPGRTLEFWLRGLGRPPTEAELRQRLKPCLDAVDYVHSLDEIHRDLTPKNIMLRPDGATVLIDFGASREGIDQSSLTSVALATAGYAPPEQCSADENSLHGRYTDIYSLGAILYRAITGRPPVSATDRSQAIVRRRAGKDPYVPAGDLPIDRSLYSPRFLSAIDQALRLDEDERPQTVSAFIDALDWSDEKLSPSGRASSGWGAEVPRVEEDATVRLQPQSSVADQKSEERSRPQAWAWMFAGAGVLFGALIGAASYHVIYTSRIPIVPPPQIVLPSDRDSKPSGEGPKAPPVSEALPPRVQAQATPLLPPSLASFRLNEAVFALGSLPNGQGILTGGDGRVVRLWDPAKGTLLASYPGHSAAVNAVAISPDGRMLASASADGEIRIADIGTPDVSRRLAKLTTAVNALAFSPDGRRLVSGGGDKALTIWAVETGAAVRSLVGHKGSVLAVAWSPDGRTIVYGGTDNIVRVRSPDTDVGSKELKGHDDWVRSVSISKDGRRYASAGDDGTINVWDAAGSTLVGRSKIGAAVSSISFSPNGEAIASGSGDGVVRLIEASSGRTLQSSDRNEAAQAVIVSDQGRFIASAGGDRIRFWKILP